jgi:multiple sugar transport system permease protein
MITSDKKERRNSIIFTFIAVLIGIVLIFPIYWMIVTSLKFEADIFKIHPTLIPEKIFIKSYLDQLKPGDFYMFQSFFNSAVIALSTMVISTVLSIPAAYGLAGSNSKGKRFLSCCFL